MLFALILCVLFLNFKPTQSILNELLKNNTDVTVSKNPFLHEVKLNNGHTSTTVHVWSYHSESKSQTPTIGKTYGLIVLTNCKLAFFIKSKFKQLFDNSNLYRMEFRVYEKFVDLRNNQNFETRLNSFLTYIDATVKEISALIYKILYCKNSDYNVSVHNDSFAIKQLFTLLIKSYYISSSIQNASNAQHAMSNIKILQLILTEMVELQKFKLMNCVNFPDTHRFSTRVKKVSDTEIENLLCTIRKITLEANDFSNGICGVDSLVHIIGISMNKELFDDIASVQAKATNDKYVSIKDIVKRIQIDYDINVIYWLHEATLQAVMKLICIRIINLLKAVSANLKIVASIIAQVFDRIQENSSATPLYIRLGFNLLNDIQKIIQNQDYTCKIKDVNVLRENIILYYNTLDYNNSSDSLAPFINVKLPDHVFKEKDVDKNHDGLVVLLQFVKDSISKFECIEYFFKPVRNQYDKYYKPLGVSKEFLIPKSDPKILEDACNFMTNVYFLWCEAFNLFNDYVKKGSIENNTKLAEPILKIKNIYLLIVKNNTDNLEFLTMAYELSVILVNCDLYHSEKESWFDFKLRQVLNVILNALNRYAIKYCTKTDPYSFLWFTKTNVDQIKDTVLKNKPNDIMFENIVNNFNSKNLDFKKMINNEDWQFFSVKYIYETFIEKSEVGSSYYEKRIQIIWNGENQSLKNIFINESHMVINPLIVNSLHDVYFKFIAAVFYLRIKEVLFASFTNTKKNSYLKNMYNKVNSYNWQDLFPETIKDILYNLDSSFLYLRDKNIEQFDVKEETTNVDNKFKKINIVFGDFNSTNVQSNSHVPNLKDIAKILDNMLHDVKTFFNGYYLKLVRGLDHNTIDKEPLYSDKT